jgi:hypothetical protein
MSGWSSPSESQDAMLKKASCLPALALLCSIGVAGVSIADGPPFTGRLPQGTVELVGVTNCPPTKQSRWWRPNGSAAHLEAPLPEKPQWLRANAGEKAFTFFCHLDNLPSDVSSPLWGINSAAEYRPGFSNSSWEGSGVSVVDHYGKLVPNCKLFFALRAVSEQTADVRVGVCMGEWQTVISQKADSAGMQSFSRDGRQWTVTFRKATAAAIAGTTQFKLTHTVPYDKWRVRLVAVDSKGKEHAPETWGGSSGQGHDGLSNDTFGFQGLPLSSIKELRFQVRPYYWVEFKNVSLQYGQKTDVQILSSDVNVNAKK